MKRLWFAIAILLALGGEAAAQRFTAIHTPVVVNSGTTPVVAANNRRNFLLLINDSDTNLYCRFGTAAAVVHEGFLLVANGGGLLLDSKFSAQAITCITLSGNGKTLLVTEGQQ